MKSTYFLAALISAVAAAKHPTYVGFPEILVCQDQNLTTFNLTRTEVLAAVTKGPSYIVDSLGALDADTPHCSEVAAPLYEVSAPLNYVGVDKVYVGFAYDKKTRTYTFCYSHEPQINDFGYFNFCAEVN